jgi:hypothetical protein
LCFCAHCVPALSGLFQRNSQRRVQENTFYEQGYTLLEMHAVFGGAQPSSFKSATLDNQRHLHNQDHMSKPTTRFSATGGMLLGGARVGVRVGVWCGCACGRCEPPQNTHRSDQPFDIPTGIGPDGNARGTQTHQNRRTRWPSATVHFINCDENAAGTSGAHAGHILPPRVPP